MIAILLTKQILSMYVFLLLGFVLVKRGILKKSDGNTLALISMYILLPCTIINAFRIEYSSEVRNNFLLSILVSFLAHIVMFLLSVILERIFHLTVIESLSLFFTNCGNLLIPIVAAVLGDEMVIYASSFLCVQMFWLWTYGYSRLIGEKKPGLKSIIQVVKNPNLIAVLAGMILFFFRIPLPDTIDMALTTGSRAVTSICMIQIGIILSDVDFRKALTNARLYLVVFLRMIVIPLVCLGFMMLCRIETLTENGGALFMPVFLAVCAPAAVVISQLAQLYGREYEYAGMINAVMTLACILTMPLMTALYMRCI